MAGVVAANAAVSTVVTKPWLNMPGASGWICRECLAPSRESLATTCNGGDSHAHRARSAEHTCHRGRALKGWPVSTIIDTMPELDARTLNHTHGAAPIGRPGVRFLFSHPAHALALGLGSGLSPLAPGTAGTAWGWVAFLALQQWLTPWQLGWAVILSLPIGWWACTVCARDMGVLDPGSIVWDEIAAFWLVLWLVMPAGFLAQLVAFVLFRFFDAAKPGPVGWADRLFHDIDPAADRRAWHKAGLGIMLDDLVAAACTLFVIAAWRWW